MNSIIEAKEEHLEDFLEMASALWEEDYSGDELRKIFQEIFYSQKNKILLYFFDKNPAGFIYLSIRNDYVEGSNSSPTGYVEGIYVKPEYRKMGIARKLFAEGEKWIKENGCKQIGSDAYINNNLSYDFHTSVGFKEAGKLVAFIKDIK
jgi:aminoglycoside 6'-N-acetyltransferase I